MGGSISMPGGSLLRCRGVKSPDLDDSLELTPREKEIVRASWTKLHTQIDTLAQEVFLKIFELKPETKKFFPFEHAVGDALVKHPYFRGHAKRFLNAVQMTVVSLDAWDLILIPNLLKLGQQHANIPGFAHEYFDCFYQAMDSLWGKYLGRTYNYEYKKAWRKIFRLITSKVEEGYAEGEEIVRRNSRMSTAVTTANGGTCPMTSVTNTANGNSPCKSHPVVKNHTNSAPPVPPTLSQEAVHITEGQVTSSTESGSVSGKCCPAQNNSNCGNNCM